MNKLELEKLVTVKVAKYWTDFLRNPSTSKFDNGDTSDNGAMAMMLSEMGKPKGYPENEVVAFESQMRANLLLNKPRHLGVDYSPDCFIADIADDKLSSWNSMSTFPCKTRMSINWEEGVVKVAEGYGASSKII
jgi:hypothetical protein